MSELKKKSEEIEIPTSRKAYQKMIDLQTALADDPNAKFGDDYGRLEHTFGDGLYTRKLFMNKGDIIVSKIHKTTHPFFVLLGACLVYDGEGVTPIKAPYHGITKAGTKRVLYILEDCVWVTVHATNETDLDKIEEELIAKDYDSLVEHIKETQL